MELRGDTRTEPGLLFPRPFPHLRTLDRLIAVGVPSLFIANPAGTSLFRGPERQSRPPQTDHPLRRQRTPTPSGPSWSNAAWFFLPSPLQDYSTSSTYAGFPRPIRPALFLPFLHPAHLHARSCLCFRNGRSSLEALHPGLLAPSPHSSIARGFYWPSEFTLCSPWIRTYRTAGASRATDPRDLVAVQTPVEVLPPPTARFFGRLRLVRARLDFVLPTHTSDGYPTSIPAAPGARPTPSRGTAGRYPASCGLDGGDKFTSEDADHKRPEDGLVSLLFPRHPTLTHFPRPPSETSGTCLHPFAHSTLASPCFKAPSCSPRLSCTASSLGEPKR